MSKRTYESGSKKRKKATAKVDALRAVIEEMKQMTQFFNATEGSFTPVDSSEKRCMFYMFWATPFRSDRDNCCG